MIYIRQLIGSFEADAKIDLASYNHIVGLLNELSWQL